MKDKFSLKIVCNICEEAGRVYEVDFDQFREMIKHVRVDHPNAYEEAVEAKEIREID